MKGEDEEFFEANLAFIDQEIAKRKSRWNLKIISWMDFDDVAQIIRFHIYKKIHLFDRKKKIGPWVNRIITNQIKNLIRDYYGNFSRPCLKCAAMEGQTGCAIYDSQCSNCPLYRKWEHTKKSAHDTKLPVSVENHVHEISSMPDDQIDLVNTLKKLETQAEFFLKPLEYKVFISLYIKNNNEEKTALLIGFKGTEKNKGIKQVKLISKSIISKISENVRNGNIEI